MAKMRSLNPLYSATLAGFSSSSRRYSVHGFRGFPLLFFPDSFPCLAQLCARPHYGMETGIGRWWHRHYVCADTPVHWTENEAAFSWTLLLFPNLEPALRWCESTYFICIWVTAAYPAHSLYCLRFSGGFGCEADWSPTRKRRLYGITVVRPTSPLLYGLSLLASTTFFHRSVAATRNLPGTLTRT